MVLMRGIISVAVLAVVLSSCSPQTPAKRYPMQGQIQGIDPVSKSATIKAGKIGDWMESMTMEYPIKPDADFARLHVGDSIQATVVVNDLKYYVTDVKIVPKTQ